MTVEIQETLLEKTYETLKLTRCRLEMQQRYTQEQIKEIDKILKKCEKYMGIA